MRTRFLHRRLRGRLFDYLRLAKRFYREERGPFLEEVPPGARHLVIAPHQDDEMIGCGGTMAKAVAAGKHVQVLFLTRGEAGRTPVETRREEAKAASALLGLPEPRFWDWPDGGVVRTGEFTRQLGQYLAEERPDTIFCPSPFERHPDHVGAFLNLQAALGDSSPDCWLYEVWSSLPTNYAVDITPFWETKMAALRAYPSQLRAADFTEKTFGLNAFRSLSYPGTRYVEAFLRLSGRDMADLARVWGEEI